MRAGNDSPMNPAPKGSLFTNNLVGQDTCFAPPSGFLASSALQGAQPAAATHGSVVYSGPWVPTVLHLHLKLFGLSLQLLFHFTFCIQAFLQFPSLWILWDPGCEPAKRTNEKLVRGMRSKATANWLRVVSKVKWAVERSLSWTNSFALVILLGPMLTSPCLDWFLRHKELKQVHSNPKSKL